MSAAVGLALCLTAVLCGGAYAGEPATNVPKTSVAAYSLELDRSTYTDGSVYDNAPPEHLTSYPCPLHAIRSRAFARSAASFLMMMADTATGSFQLRMLITGFSIPDVWKI